MKKAEQAHPNALLSYERERCHWTQDEVAEQIGVPDAKMVGRWERGITLPTAHSRQKLITLFGKSARELGFVREGEIPFWNVPYQRNAFFTGREDILLQLHSLLSSEKAAALAPLPQALSGLGGVGKTQIAIEYAYRYRNDYQAVLWVRADSQEVLASDVAALGILLNLPEHQEQDQNRIITAVKQWLAAMTRWLLIFDNADDLDLLHDILPSPCRGHILLTTRTHVVQTLAHTLEVEAMPPEEGASFLLRRSKMMTGDAALTDVAETDYQQALIISQTLGSLPLALDQAGAYIEETACGLSSYLTLYNMRRSELLHWRGELVGDHPEPVATTWSLALEKVRQENIAAIELLQLFAFLTPDAIAEEILTEGALELGPFLAPIVADSCHLDISLKELQKFSLIHCSPETHVFTIHRLVQAVVLDGMEKETQRQWAERVVRVLNRVFPTGEDGTWQQCERLLPQIRACVKLIRQWNLFFPEAVHLITRAGLYQMERARYVEAECLLQHARDYQERIQGAKPSDVVRVLHLFARLCYKQGKYAKAASLFQEALVIQEQRIGLENESTSLYTSTIKRRILMQNMQREYSR